MKALWQFLYLCKCLVIIAVGFIVVTLIGIIIILDKEVQRNAHW